MKALLVTTDYPPALGGVARYYSSLVAHLPHGSVDVLVPQPGKLWPHWLPWLGLVRRASRLADVVWVGQLLPVGTVAWILRLMGGKPYIVSCHGMDVLLPLGNPWKRWLARRVLRSASGITANSRYTAEQISGNYGIPSQRVTIVYPAPADLPVLPRAEAPEPTILAVGRLVRRKGFDTLIAAMEAIWREQPNARLEIIGSGPERGSLAAAAAASSRPAQVKLLGDVADADLAAAYSRAWAFCLPARAEGADVEGFGMVCVEAAAAGVPTVATATGGVGEAVDDGATGLLVQPADGASLAAALLKLLQDGSYRSRLGSNGPAWAARFSWSTSADALAESLRRST